MSALAACLLPRVLRHRLRTDEVAQIWDLGYRSGALVKGNRAGQSTRGAARRRCPGRLPCGRSRALAGAGRPITLGVLAQRGCERGRGRGVRDSRRNHPLLPPTTASGRPTKTGSQPPTFAHRAWRRCCTALLAMSPVGRQAQPSSPAFLRCPRRPPPGSAWRDFPCFHARRPAWESAGRPSPRNAGGPPADRRRTAGGTPADLRRGVL